MYEAKCNMEQSAMPHTGGGHLLGFVGSTSRVHNCIFNTPITWNTHDVWS